MLAMCVSTRVKLSFVIYPFLILLLSFGLPANAQRMYAQKVNELPGELQDFIQINGTTGNIIILLKSHSSDAVHVPLVSLKSGSQLEFRISREIGCCTKNLHTQKWSFIYTGEDKCCLDMAWTSGPEKMINVGYQGGEANAYAYADKSAVIQIEGSIVKAIGTDDDQGNATIFCKLDADKSNVEGDVSSYNIPFAMWNVPHSYKGDCDIQLEFVGFNISPRNCIYKLEAQWPSRAAVKKILIGTGAGLIALTIIIGVVCVLIALWHPEEQLNTALSYSHVTNSLTTTRPDAQSQTSKNSSGEVKRLQSRGTK